eukprot:scaffold79526_cov44-Prasinocladus_malaysianus.AAC.1
MYGICAPAETVQLAGPPVVLLLGECQLALLQLNQNLVRKHSLELALWALYVHVLPVKLDLDRRRHWDGALAHEALFDRNHIELLPPGGWRGQAGGGDTNAAAAA